MINLLTANTPNGVKIPIALEELGLAYRITPINLAEGDQRSPAFLAHNPNGRIPVLIDAGPGQKTPLSIFESGAILLYLAETYGGLLPADRIGRVRALEYLFLQAAGVGPMFGQAGWFMRSAPSPMPIAIERYQAESRRLTGVLEARLTQAPWLAGETYSIADIAHFGWLRVAGYAAVDLGQFPLVADWVQRNAGRPATERALARLDSATRLPQDSAAAVTARAPVLPAVA